MNCGELVVGIMASFSPRPFSARELIELTRPFGVTPVSLRTSLSRLKKKGAIAADARGSARTYVFSAKGAAITANVALSFDDPEWTGWDGEFWGVLFSLPAGESGGRYRITKKLALYRFAPLYPGFWIRPYGNREGLNRKLGDVFSDRHCRILRFRPVPPLTRSEAAGFWDIAGARSRMRDAQRRALAVLGRVRALTPVRAFMEKFRTGERIVSALFTDPLLPKEFLPADWPGRGLRKLFARFDSTMTKASRPFWEPILGKRRER